ncbi:MAG: NUDIX domain-containing protein [Erysipelotrichaceae bacterium]|nr:NUDIX domain-containing protein [Erysipelotrichaceae bacterium]
MKLIDKIALIYLKDGKILTTLSKGKDTYYLPGGKREGSETDAETLIRELREELSIQILPETIVPYGIFEAQAHGKAEGVLVRMSCYTAEFEGELKPANEIAELDWFTYKDKERTSAVDQIIFDDLKQKGLLG